MDRAEQAIWQVKPDLAALDKLHENTAVSLLGIRMDRVGNDYLEGSMMVDARTQQPFGLLHGGASVLLLETLASAAAINCVNLDTHMCAGLEINCNHLRGVTAGRVTGCAKAIHIGARTMVWDLSTRDEQQRLVTSGRMTSAVIPR